MAGEVYIQDPGFDYLKVGAITLPDVPIIGAAIQVGIPEAARDAAHKTEMKVNVLEERERLTVARATDEPFTIQFSETGVDHAEVLGHSVGGLRFRKASSGLWQVDVEGENPLAVVHEHGFQRFNNILAYVALGLQNPKPKLP